MKCAASIGLNTGMETFATFVTEASSMRVGSSNLKSIRYNGKTMVLTIYFRSGGVYRYFGVEPETVEELKFAASKGQYFYKFIRDVYQYERVKASRPGFKNAFNSTADIDHFGFTDTPEQD